MKRKHFNAISSGARGMFGKQVVIYTRYGEEIIAKAPRKRPGLGTPDQERTKADFKKAAEWSARVRGNAGLKALYKAGLSKALNVHNLAIADFLVAPEVHEVLVEKGRVRVHATDNFRVAEVVVEVYGADGQLLEAGVADSEGGDWFGYVPAEMPVGGRVVVIARDLPGNECRSELAIETTELQVVACVKCRVADTEAHAICKKTGNSRMPVYTSG
ncbi:hypothetical protein MKQ68_12250 [Chitinophaga horti]|uniref:Uncharacterized protein n=1 Tax=Chitinophaga horti TaxID=2920382 RepID=A0ABY6J865_9BACT|nr:hypothetical protein [Chitinophaga horti]UYQ95871.1 hypothetical protein MKQ68_12250 [Chitinophaga horti]